MITALRTATLRAAALGVLLLLTTIGCSGGNSGPSDYDKKVAAEQEKAATLSSAGVKTQQKSYPIGTAWVVDMTGVTVTDDLLKQVKALGNVSELDLKNSTVTDSHLALMKDLGIHLLLNKLDLSGTAVTDACLTSLDGNLYLADLNLTKTAVTAAGVDQFKKRRQANPLVKIKNTNVRR